MIIIETKTVILQLKDVTENLAIMEKKYKITDIKLGLLRKEISSLIEKKNKK